MSYTPLPIVPPWTGVACDQPAMLLPLNSFNPASFNWYIDQGRLRTGPAVKKFGTAGTPGQLPGGDQAYGARSFLDLNGNWHTCFVGFDHLYALQEVQPYAVYSTWTGPTLGSQMRATVLSWLNALVWTAAGGSDPYYAIGDGTYASCGAPEVPKYLGVLAGHLILANLKGGGGALFPNRIRWSGVNDYTDYASYSSGAADLDTFDSITGYLTQGRMGYVYSYDKIISLNPTGSTPTFDAETYTDGAPGVGCKYPNTLAKWSNIAGFVADDDVYFFWPDIGPPVPIGGAAVRAIQADIAVSGVFNSSTTPSGFFLKDLADGVDYLSYWLFAPNPNSNIVKLWIYKFRANQPFSGSWTPHILSGTSNPVNALTEVWL